MPKKRAQPVKSAKWSDITPEKVYWRGRWLLDYYRTTMEKARIERLTQISAALADDVKRKREKELREEVESLLRPLRETARRIEALWREYVEEMVIPRYGARAEKLLNWKLELSGKIHELID